MIRPLAAAALLALAAPAAAQSIAIEEITSPGGLQAWLVSDDTIPIVTIEAQFGGGAATDPDGAEGVARMMASLLTEGAGARDVTEFAIAADDLGLRLSFDAGLDGVSLSASMLAENVAESLALIRDALMAPRFDADAVERVRARQLATIRSDAANPARLATAAFYAAAFAGHPYARPPGGTEDSVAALSVADIAEAHQRLLTTGRLHVAIVGAIGAEEAGQLLDTLFGDLPADAPDPLAPATVDFVGATEVIDFGMPQSLVVFGHEGIPRDDPDFIPAFVMNHMLGGGGFQGRLQREVREQRGLTYGIYSYLAPHDSGWLHLGQFSSANDRVAEAIEVVRAEWARMAAGDVTEDELNAAKRYLTGAYALRFDGNARIAAQLLGLQLAGLGPDYVNMRNDLVESVTLEDIARVAARILRPEALSMVVVGQPEGLDLAN